MKKLLLVLIVLGTMSCNVVQYYEPKFSLGMEEQEFKRFNKSAVQVYGDQNSSAVIYRTYNHITEAYKFFVFEKQKLVKFEEGTYPDDHRFIRL
ncbi:hypothetical protein [Pedobacter sp. SL55]|uniref:hypothetical protein n=1 Tax=Pedobacter sp. SL55 TaxID=2995161 RepID=UPI00226D7BE6|nr:hypothetical protein [Pedobacter sp. SL55]WAC39086.1 hypothetical protein OVA16_10715 [Pedobacter sp. SL55]